MTIESLHLFMALLGNILVKDFRKQVGLDEVK